MSSDDQKFNPFFGGNSSKNKVKKPAKANLLETLRDTSGGAPADKKLSPLPGPEDFVRKMFGIEKTPVSISGELKPGQSLDLEAAIAAERKENKVLKQQLLQEKRLNEEEKSLMQKKTQELKVELHALTQEIQNLAKSTQGLSQEVETAAFQAPASPGVYHVVFFEKLREFIASFRKKIENASIWLQAYNQRAKRKHTFWGQVSRAGSKRLLSPEDYLQRSAG